MMILFKESVAILCENCEVREDIAKVTLTSGEQFAAKIGQFMNQNFIMGRSL